MQEGLGVVDDMCEEEWSEQVRRGVVVMECFDQQTWKSALSSLGGTGGEGGASALHEGGCLRVRFQK